VVYFSTLEKTQFMKALLAATALLSLFIFSGCSSPEVQAKDHAEQICDCIKSIGIDEDIDIFKLQDRKFMREVERKAERELPQKLLVILKEIDEELSDLSKNDKKEYTRALLKSLLDTDCADIALDNIPYDMLGLGIDVMEDEFEVRDRYINEF
jgi:hypothetical protein